MSFAKKILGILLVLSLLTVVSGNAVAFVGLGYIPQQVIGKKAWDFTLTTVKDKEFKLSKSIEGKRALILFWATWCPHCRKQLKKIDSLYKELTKKDIVVVLVSIGESKVAVKKYLDRNKYDFDVVMDYKDELGGLYPFPGIPALFFVDGKGIIKALFYGLPDNYEKYF